MNKMQSEINKIISYDSFEESINISCNIKSILNYRWHSATEQYILTSKGPNARQVRQELLEVYNKVRLEIGCISVYTPNKPTWWAEVDCKHLDDLREIIVKTAIRQTIRHAKDDEPNHKIKLRLTENIVEHSTFCLAESVLLEIFDDNDRVGNNVNRRGEN